MTDQRSELLPCPNPWCAQSDPFVGDCGDRFKGIVRFGAECRRCGMAAPRQATAAAAIAAWNTRAAGEADETPCEAWRDAAQPAPEGQPVIALYRAWNRPNGRWMKHVVWWREGGWRIYPFTSSNGFVDRWKPLGAAA